MCVYVDRWVMVSYEFVTSLEKIFIGKNNVSRANAHCDISLNNEKGKVFVCHISGDIINCTDVWMFVFVKQKNTTLFVFITFRV